MSTIREVEVEIKATVEIIVDDDAPKDWLSRVTDHDFPYRMKTENAGLEHLAFNATVNGVRDANDLDGWADVLRGMVRVNVKQRDFEAEVVK